MHGYVLMGNHYHLVVETPAGNLGRGMSWLQRMRAFQSGVKVLARWITAPHNKMAVASGARTATNATDESRR